MFSSLQVRQVVAFVITWLSYASTYLLRKPLGVIKPDLEKTLHLKKSQIGWLDAALLLPYALMQMLLGGVGDKIGARKALSICLIGSALSMVSFGYWRNYLVLAVLLFLNGTFQATAWPNCVKCLSLWYSDEQCASIFGLWGTCIFAGGIIGTSLAVYLQSIYSPDLEIVFIVPSLGVFLLGILVFLTLSMPSDLDIDIPGKTSMNESGPKEKKLSIMDVCLLKTVPELLVAVICVKLVRYCLYMWLPMYLHETLQYTKAQAGMLSITFEVGGIIGSAAIGLFINRILNDRDILGCFIAIFLSAVSLGLFHITSTWGLTFNIAFTLLIGIFNCSPTSILTGSVPAHIGGKVNAQATVSGVVNGFGGAGAVIEGPVIGFIVEYYGWSGAFYFMMVLSVVASVSLLKGSQSFNEETKS